MIPSGITMSVSNRFTRSLCCSQIAGLHPGVRLHNLVTGTLQNRLHHAPDGDPIIHEQNGFMGPSP